MAPGLANNYLNWVYYSLHKFESQIASVSSVAATGCPLGFTVSAVTVILSFCYTIHANVRGGSEEGVQSIASLTLIDFPVKILLKFSILGFKTTKFPFILSTLNVLFFKSHFVLIKDFLLDLAPDITSVKVVLL